MRGDCCSFAYTCPTTRERECLVHGGFEVCCGDPRCAGYEPTSIHDPYAEDDDYFEENM